MRLTLAAMLLVIVATACGGGGTASNTDMSSATQTLTVDNTLSWCSVTVTVGNASPVTFTNASHAFQAAAGTTVNLTATPLPSFLPVKWTGTTTMNGSSATYVMTSAASQTVTACCPESNGSGC